MSTATIAPRQAADALEPWNFPARLAASVLRHFRAQVEDWCDACRQLSEWEDANLLEGDTPAPERLATHARLLDELERVGRWLALASESKDFPDTATAQLVAVTQRDLLDRRAMWHSPNPLPREQADAVLASVFPE